MLAPGSKPIEESLAAIEAAVRDAAELPTMTMAPAELHSFAVGLQPIRARVDALLCAVTADADRAGAQTSTGQRSLPTSIASKSNADAKVVAVDRLLGRWLAGYPTFREAFAAGQITRRHVQELRKIDNPRTRMALKQAQDYLLAAALSCDWKDFTRALKYWLLAADPDGAEPKAQRDDRKGSIVVLADGTVKQASTFDAVTGAAVKNAVEARAKQMWREDTEAAKADPEFVVRTHRQRIADASAELQIAGHGLGPNGSEAPAGAPPLIHVVVSENVAEDMLIRLADPDGVANGTYPGIEPDRLPLDVHDIDQRCELVDGTPIHPAQVVALMATATLRRMVFGAESEVLDLGKAVRGFPRRLKQALLAKARGRCEIDGCDAPLAWLEADHIFPSSKGGPTALHNGQMLCGPHNRVKADRIDPPQRE